MGRVFPWLLLLASWTAVEAFKAHRMWKSLDEWIPQWNYTEARSKGVKAAARLQVENNANEGRGNGTTNDVAHFARTVTSEHFAHDARSTSNSGKAGETPVKTRREKKILEKNMIPSHKIGTSHVIHHHQQQHHQRFSEDNNPPVVKIRILREKEALPPTGAEQRINVPPPSSRQHKAFFMNYPSSQRVYQQESVGTKKKKKKKKPAKHKVESDIYFIRLPPAPYSFVPGLGYVSQPTKFSTMSLDASDKLRPPPPPSRKPQSSIIKLPLQFVSNGKPTAVYRLSPSTSTSNQQQQQQQQQNNHRLPMKEESKVIKLNRGPYIFDGRPVRVYLLKKDTRPTPNLV